MNDQLRGKGYGSSMLKLLKDTYPDQNIVLNIQPVEEQAENYEQRVKRLRFYERNGFHRSGWFMKDNTGSFDTLMTSDKLNVRDLQKLLRRFGLGLYRPDLIRKLSCTISVYSHA